MEAIGAARFLFLTGAMGFDLDGKAPAGLEAQFEVVWSNIRRLLTEANMTTDSIVRLTGYLHDPSYSEANQNARIVALGDRRIPTTAVVAGTLLRDWLVEIKAIVAA